MADTATSRGRLRKQTLASNVNIWGDPYLNTNFDLLDQQVDGVTTIALGTSTATTLTSTNYGTDQQRNKAWIFTGTGVQICTVSVPQVEQVKLVVNQSAGPVVIAPAAGTPVTVAAGERAWIYNDGTNFGRGDPTLDKVRAPTAAVSLNSQRITNLSDPSALQDAATKSYVDQSMTAGAAAATFLTVSTSSILQNERVLTPAANELYLSTGTAGGAATIGLSTSTVALGTRTITGGTFSGVASSMTAKSSSGTAFLPLSAWLDSPLLPEALGAVGDGSTDNRAVIQAVFDAAAAKGPGAEVVFGPGCFVTSGPLYVRAGMVIRGSGRGALPTANGGTTLRASYGNADIISIQSDGGVTIRDMCIDAAGQTCTAGAAIRVAGVGSAAESQNKPSCFEGLYIKEVWDGISIKDAQNYHISGNWIFNYKGIGIDINPTLGTGDTADTNGGQSHIIGNTIQDLSGTYDSAANIRYCNGGDVRIIGNKLIGGQRGVWLYLTAGPTGTLIVQGNSIEQHATNGVVAEQATSGAMFGSLMVENNQFLDIDTTPSAMIEVKAGTPTGGEWVDKWINLIQASGNCIGMALPVDTVSYGILISDGAGVNVSNNIIHGLNRAGPKGIKIGSGASSVQVANNIGIQIPSGLYDTLPSGVSVQDVDMSSGAWRTFRNGSGVLAKMDDLANGIEVVIGSDGTDAYIGANNAGSKTRLLAGATEVMRLQNEGAGRYVYVKSSETGNCAIGSNQNEINVEGAHWLPWVDNAATLGKVTQKWASVWSNTGAIQTSDARQKTDDVTLDGAKCWDFVSRLRPLVFRWIVGGRDAAWNEESQSWDVTDRAGVRRHAGFFAQEVRQALEDADLEITGLWVEDQATGEQGLRHDQLTPYIVAGFMWRDAQREARLDALEQAVAALRSTGKE